ncbi:tectonic-1 isoform X1 [Cydia pomonella]|uniref:tectonic-1 isoform X1 n=1 Tax=Cydia pomonella TaxID=82600 RepID=UPI002ADDD770|nr:tectonic-1 isoform X1 [Cydia pomonella]
MKVITYLGFTLLSILIQFSVMDFIQERLQPDEKPLISNITSNRKLFRDILQEYSKKPHALYYRTLNQLQQYKNLTSTTKKYDNVTLNGSTFETTTDTLSTTFEDLFDESSSMSDVETTTDSFYTSTEIENVTEFTLFEKKNKTMNKPNSSPKRRFTKDMCHCNLLFKVCDINCCCDSDCSEADINLFKNCDKGALDGKRNDVCYPQFSIKPQTSNIIGNLFCIAKTNLPEKRNVNKYDREFATRTMDMTLKWQKTTTSKDNIEFTKEFYKSGDPIWLLKNGSIGYLDVSTPEVNHYCTGRKMIKFLEDERIQCNIKITHLEMIQLYKTIEETTIISVIDRTLNTSVLNCSNVHCTNWTVIICNDTSCINYNKSLHEPLCTDSQCTHIALKIDYIFYYHNLKIVNATVKLFIQNVSMNVPLMKQDISVRFHLANISIEQAVKFSGNPGYISNRAVIVSHVESNHTDNFFNSSSMHNHFILPVNENGKCTISNTAKDELKFGSNKRTKCRLYLEHKFLSYNATHACRMIHASIQDYLGLNYTSFVSPYGNPRGQEDAQWIPLQVQAFEKDSIMGEFVDGESTLVCRNIVAAVSLIFTYADLSATNDQLENKILTAAVQRTAQNITLQVDDFTTVLTVDVTFVDVTKPPVYEFAGSPDFNIHLPADFFFPFPNRAFVNRCNLMQLIYICGAMFITIK